jgi:hypothetical protein
MFWLGKDFSWNQNNKGLWVFFLIPTLSVAADFIWVTFRTKVRYFAACNEFRSCGYSSLSSVCSLAEHDGRYRSLFLPVDVGYWQHGLGDG